MKELSIEEKAKHYDEALKRARKIENGEPINVPDGTSIPAAIFPELYESEGERIRKQIISFLKEFEYDHYRSLDFSSWIAWLEKQGEQKETLCDKCRKEHPSHFCQDITALGRCALEKQGEQKPINDTDEDIVEVIKNTSILDMVEPKFKVGDWITDGNSVLHITSMDSGFYQFEDSYDVKAIIDKKYHLWTIADAKDGDILAVNSEVFIYAHRKQMYPIVVAHCFVDSAGGFRLDGEFGFLERGNSISPATKEQRDLLFAKMKESGYEWNEDEKELIKL